MSRKIFLEVSFDVQQISDKLDWSFDTNDSPIRPSTGLNTGMLPFFHYDTVQLNVTGKSHNGVLESLSITQCHLIARPLLNSALAVGGTPGDYPAPSPFSESSAVTDFVNPIDPVPASGNSESMKWESNKALVCDNLGRWELSLVLTANIKLTHKAGSYMAHRVFSFDPECEVGTGVGSFLTQ